VLTLKDELLRLRPQHEENAAAIARQARLADDLIAEAAEEGAFQVEEGGTLSGREILFHGHCHQKAAGAQGGSIRLLEAIPGADVRVLDAGCCGMAGSFGFEREHYELSIKVGGLRLFPSLTKAGPEAVVAATGVSCRQQISHGTGHTARHPISLFRSLVGNL
jgi:Fe-S oxidoreductase